MGALVDVPRYFFHIRNGYGFTRDEEGLELPSQQHAREQAIAGARSLMSAEVLDGMLDLDGQIEVTDAGDRPVMTIRYREAVRVRPSDLSQADD